jgi:probable rRNA maturation factor
MFKVSVNAQLAKSSAPQLARQLRRAHAMLKPPLAELSVALIDDAQITELHDRYMGIDSPTDVLTFELDHDGRGHVTSGEVVVCVPEARRQAKQRGTSVYDELLLYALHGMLHLCGYDDRTAAGFRRMHAMEDRILTRLGVGPVFAFANATSPGATARKRGRHS